MPPLTHKRCERGHAIDAGQLDATELRLPCGCPATSEPARRDEGLSADVATDALASEPKAE